MAGRERLGQDELAEHLGRVLVELLDRGALVAAVEEAQEVAAVPAVEGQQRRAPRPGSWPRSGAARRGRGGGWPARRRTSTTLEAMSVFSRSKAARWRSGRQHLAPQPVVRGSGPVRAPGRGPDPGVLDDRRQVDLADVAVPVDRPRGSKQNVGLVVGVRRVPQGEQPVDAVDGLALGVGAVELDVAEGPLGLLAPLLDGGAPLGLLAPQRQRRDSTFSARSSTVLARSSWPCTRPRPGNDHSGTTMGWPVAVVERVLGEPGADQVDQAAGSAAGSREPDATCTTSGRLAGSAVGPSAATAMMAATTRSTGMTSTMPSGTPGNSLSRPRA